MARRELAVRPSDTLSHDGARSRTLSQVRPVAARADWRNRAHFPARGRGRHASHPGRSRSAPDGRETRRPHRTVTLEDGSPQPTRRPNRYSSCTRHSTAGDARRATRARRRMPVLRRDDRTGDGRGVADRRAHGPSRLGQGARTPVSSARARRSYCASEPMPYRRIMTSVGPRLSRERWTRFEPLLDVALELDRANVPRFSKMLWSRAILRRREVRALLGGLRAGGGNARRPRRRRVRAAARRGHAELPRLLGGRYHLVREIGRGGMATVYLAEDPKHGRQVAVKVLHADVAKLIGPERFMREIEIAARLSHPHILPLHDSGEDARASSERRARLSLLRVAVRGRRVAARSAGARRRVFRITEVGAVGPRDRARARLRASAAVSSISTSSRTTSCCKTDTRSSRISGSRERCRARATRHRCCARAVPLLGTPSYMSPEQALGERPTSTDEATSTHSDACCTRWSRANGRSRISRPTTSSETLPHEWTRTRRSLLKESVPGAGGSRDFARCLQQRGPFRDRRRLAAALSGAEREVAATSFDGES